MRKNILLGILFGILLACGVIAVSCDNGVLPEHRYDQDHPELEFDGEEVGNMDTVIDQAKDDLFSAGS